MFSCTKLSVFMLKESSLYLKFIDECRVHDLITVYEWQVELHSSFRNKSKLVVCM